MKISLIGAGPGSRELICAEAEKLINDADILIGAPRLTEVFGSKKTCFNLYKPEEITEKIKNTGIGKNVVVLLTGDPGFFSSAKKLMKLLDTDEALKGQEISVIPGISSMQYFCENLHLSWENVLFTSLHGRQANIIGYIKNKPRVFTLLGNGNELRETCEKLHYYDMDNVRLIIGERLSYEDENIILTDPKKFLDENIEPDKLSVALFINDKAEERTYIPLKDEEFVRGEVPMTKEEIRTISLAKLGLKSDSILFDIGAGTGSISVEAALKLVDGEVYAIERNSAGIDLIRENKRKHAADNVNIISGLAPDCFEGLKKPTHAFIGGSGGRLRDIVKRLRELNPSVRIVVNIVSLDSLNELSSIIKDMGLKSEISLISVTKVQDIAGHKMMKGTNPVYIVLIEPDSVSENPAQAEDK